MTEYPKDQILFYFESVETIIEGQIFTKIFHRSLLPYVDELCWLYRRGKWIPAKTNGGTNWYIEFKKYIRQRNDSVISTHTIDSR